MRIVVIGGTGHIGTYLVPRLAEAGHETIVVSRGKRRPYADHPAWRNIRQESMDRASAEAAGGFGKAIAALEPDAVIDLVCFTPESARHIVEALRGKIAHFLHCGTIWVHGHGVEVPITEDQPRNPFGSYGIQKAQIEAFLLSEARKTGFPATIIHPGHIVGPGWPPLNPAGHFNPEVFERLAAGKELALPNFGLETVHHVHADDVAAAFVCALENRDRASGQSFHTVSPAAITLRGYAETVASWFGQTARLTFMPWEEWTKTASPEDAHQTWEHIARSPSCSIEKAQRFIGYRPRYTSPAAVRESVAWLLANGRIRCPDMVPSGSAGRKNS